MASELYVFEEYTTCPIGPRYEVCEHDWDFDHRVGWPYTPNYCRTIGIRERINMEYLGKKKVCNYKALSTLWFAMDALSICLFASAPARVLSEGLTSADDMLPDRFYEVSIDCGMHEGVKLNRDTFRECVDTYYAMMGWDENGLPAEATLYDFGLNWAVE